MSQLFAFSFLAMMTISGIACAYGNNETTEYYNEWGQKIGSAKKEYNGTVGYYNEWGQKTGSAKQTYNGTTEYYNEWGQKVGFAR